jgi:4-aminobutyrate aminotransferase
MHVIEQENILSKVQDDSAFIKQRLLKLKEQFSIIGDVRGIGLLWGVELVSSQQHKTRAFDEAEAMLYECLTQGLSFKVSQGNVIQLSPPLIITRKQLNQALTIFETALNKISKEFNYV